MKNRNPLIPTKVLSTFGVFILPLAMSAAETPDNEGWTNPLLWFLISIIILLAFAITTLANVIKNISNTSGEADKHKSVDNQKNGAGKIVTLLFLLSLPVSKSVAATSGGVQSVGGMPFSDFYFLVSVILIEIAVIFALINVVKLRYSSAIKKKVKVVKKEKSILEKINVSVEIENEKDIMLAHDYDGIRELDNQLPPWWKYGFYLTIVVAVMYLLHYHVLKTGNLQVAELEQTITIENEKVAAYLKESANNVDELTVKYLDNAADKAAGQEIFVSLCSSCHGRLGEGTVGPNLTDNYWIHGGTISSIFKSVKYGWTEKGMRAWKDELSPVKIAQVSSYIKSLVGSNPPNAKEKQGELYLENGKQTSDSLSMPDGIADSLKSGV
jgi:cytochrome c oxidase cbb3-type subunit III